MTAAAKGVELATAYVSISARTDEMAGQIKAALQGAGSQARAAGQSIGSHLSAGIKSNIGGASTLAAFKPMEIAGVRWAVKAGAAIGSALKTAIAGAIGGLGLGAIFGAGGILSAGLDRLKTLQQSTVQLSLKLNPDEIKSLQKQISDVVTGTPIPLDKAMQAVPKAINAGLRGDQIKQYIKDIADLTASTGGQGQFDQLAVILEQVRSKGKLAGDEMQQLVDAGVDVRGILKEAFGWDDKTLERNLAKGKVGINELQKAIQKSFGSTAAGGLAKQMGETFDGAIGGLKASAARLGANFIAAILGKKADEDPLKDFALGIGNITKALNGAGAWVDEHRDDIHNVFVRAGDAGRWMGDKISQVGPKVREVIDWFKQLGDQTREVGNWFSTTWEKAVDGVGRVKDKVGQMVGHVSERVKSAFETVRTKISEIVDDLHKKFEGIFGENGWFAQQFDKLGKLVDKVRDVLGLGPATAGAAAPGASGAAPFNPGPMAPGKFGPYASRSGLVPGTRLDGSDQRIAGMPGGITTSGAAKTLNFDKTVAPQEYQFDCGPGSAQIILNGRGVIQSEDSLISQMGTNQGGTNFGGGNISGTLNKALPGAGYREVQAGGVGVDQFFTDLSQSINSGFGAMLNWNTEAGGPVPVGIKGTTATPYSGGIQHYVAAMGVDPADQSVLIADPKDGRQYWISADNALALSRNRGYVTATGGGQPAAAPGPPPDNANGGGGAGGGGQPPNQNPSLLDRLRGWLANAAGFSTGGGVWGAGSATSDSIPAWLSNGEHVLTAADVKAMGGQQGVYAFRNALKDGKFALGGAVGFAPGGAVDPNTVQDAQDSLADLNNQYAVAQAHLNEVLQSEDPKQSEILSATQETERIKRNLDNAQADLPTIMSGGTPPDRSAQNHIFDTTNQLEMAQQTLKEQQDSGEDIPYSQQLQSQYAVDSAMRERNQAIANAQAGGKGSDYGQDFIRSLGFTPSGASSSTVAGTSSLAGFINMGNSVVSGVIDTGVNLANTAVSAAISAGAAAGTFGAGAAAAPAASMAASYGIQLAGNEAKRISSYWFGLAGIGADAALEIMSPFGVPRWLGYDYAGMTPQLGIQQAATSTLEKMGGDAINKALGPQSGQQGSPMVPAVRAAADQPTNTEPSGPSAGATTAIPAPAAAPTPAPQDPTRWVNPGEWVPAPPWLDPNNPGGGGAGGGGGGGGSWAKGGPVGIYDNGGVLKPGQLAFNASRTPESVLTKHQWNAMAANASNAAERSGPLVENLYAQDMQDAIRQLEKTKRRDAMQFTGRG